MSASCSQAHADSRDEPQRRPTPRSQGHCCFQFQTQEPDSTCDLKKKSVFLSHVQVPRKSSKAGRSRGPLQVPSPRPAAARPRVATWVKSAQHTAERVVQLTPRAARAHRHATGRPCAHPGLATATPAAVWSPTRRVWPRAKDGILPCTMVL